MSTTARSTSSNTSFFSFGPDDGFISKSFEGLRYRNLPPALHKLIIGGSVVDVHWAALGPVQESWVLNFKDASGKSNLAWGSLIPIPLRPILSTLAPSPHLRVFLGPGSSFVAWDPTFIRWHSLPTSLEASIQSWLTPAGWKAGAPKTATWNARGACFATSEYGEVVVRAGENGDEESAFEETVAEWGEESGFRWGNVAYLNLDPVNPDQFIAIRHDGAWAGSTDSETNEEALEAFALNFFAPLKPKPTNSKPQPRSGPTSQPQPQPQGKPKPTAQSQRSSSTPNGTTNGLPNSIPTTGAAALDPIPQSHYEAWATTTANLLALALTASTAPSPSPSNTSPTSTSRPRAPKKLQIRTPQPTLLTTFPYLPVSLTICAIPVCVIYKASPSSLRACKHDVERFFRASGLYGYEWLRQERIRWHPDRFGRLCEEGYREEGRRVAEEMFKVLGVLIEGVGAGGGGG